MKKIQVILVFVLSFLLSGCNDEFVGSREPKPLPAMLTFGFYAEDNVGVLSSDYVGVITSSSPARITVALPALVGKEHLVARFTTTQGHQVVVDGKVQQSGQTQQDFSVPVDYYVTDGRQYTRYELCITKEGSIHWRELPVYTAHTIYSVARLAVNPVNQVPYLAFKSRKDMATGESDTYAYVMRYSVADQEWEPLGHTANNVYSSYLGFDFAPDGIPYIAYGNYDEKPYATCVERVVEDGDWQMIGADLEKAQTNYLGFVALSSDRLITSMVGNTSATYYRTNATSIYNGTDWYVGNGPCGSQVVYKSTMTKFGDKAYLAVMDRSTFVIKVYEYSQGAWSELEGFQEEGISNGIGSGVFKLTTDHQGNVYMLNADNATGQYLVKLRKYDVQTRLWSTVSGNATSIDAHDTHLYACAAIAPDGTPFIAYGDLQDPNTCLKVICLDPETRQWSAPVVVSLDKVGNDISFVISPSGAGYLSFVDGNSMLHVFVAE